MFQQCNPLGMVSMRMQFMDRIQGVHGYDLPWDDACLTVTNLGRLGGCRSSLSSLMAQLSCNPSQRPSM